MEKKLGLPEKKEFFRRYFSLYFVYGYLSLAGTVLIFAIAFILLKKLPAFNRIVFAWLISGGIAVFILFMRIVTTTGTKFRFYKIADYVLRMHDGNREFFVPYMDKACYRIMIWDLFFKYGKKEEYKVLKRENK